MFGLRSGSLILWTVLAPGSVFAKNSAVCSVAQISNPIWRRDAIIGKSLSLFLVPPMVTSAIPECGMWYPTDVSAFDNAS